MAFTFFPSLIFILFCPHGVVAGKSFLQSELCVFFLLLPFREYEGNKQKKERENSKAQEKEKRGEEQAYVRS